MASKAIKKIQREYREASGYEIRAAVFENALYGFLGSIIVVFITTRIDIAVLLGYLCYYFFLSKVVNRPKYVTSLGKFILFPIPTSIGAFIGYKLAGYLSMYIML